ncbi:MAG TPA: YifB family Mg chelatase-like AAA ATPase [Acidimicrobiia bacterium]|nr:YifB family Mg chelatase-like AAA ATPase [Acidimicrobiia bacterium]
MLACVRSAMLFGVEGLIVDVQVHVSTGLPSYTFVGLPDAAVRESRDRVRAAILSSGLTWPMRRVTVNLAPSGVRKSGPGLDLPFALGLMMAAEELPAGVLDGVGVIGELGLDGSLRPVPGVLAMVDALRRAGTGAVLVPAGNAAEAALVGGARVLPATSLIEARAALKGEGDWASVPEPPPGAGDDDGPEDDDAGPDLAVVRGLKGARRALEVAAAGGHHLLMVGRPGAGKTLLARCLPSILPPLDSEEALEVSRIHSAAGRAIQGRLVRDRPFRAPHHTASAAALVGGGRGRPRPGEVTLAHRGILFMDELAEFAPTVLDALRQPLEDRVVRIARQGGALTFPADLLLVACSNPCPCGLGPPDCLCSEPNRARYRRRLSAPLVDRFDLRVALGPAAPGAALGVGSEVVKARVAEAMARQRSRYRDRPWRRNARVPAGALSRAIPLDGSAGDTLREVAERRSWSGRGMAAVHRVARTMADLDGRAAVAPEHVLLAAGLREEVL